MKLFAFLPIALCNLVPSFFIENDGFELKFGHSLCESDECPDLGESVSKGKEIITDEISSTSCSKEYKNSFLSGRLDRCEYYNADHSDCVEWAKKELDSACGGSHNCIETYRGGMYNGWATYWGYSSK